MNLMRTVSLLKFLIESPVIGLIAKTKPIYSIPMRSHQMPDLAAIIIILFATYNYFLKMAWDGQPLALHYWQTLYRLLHTKYSVATPAPNISSLQSLILMFSGGHCTLLCINICTKYVHR